MAIKYAGHWSPDTCECVISIEGDNAHPLNLRVHTMASIQHYESVKIEVVRNTVDDPEFRDLPGFEHYDYIERRVERRLVDGPCSAAHPTPRVGDAHEGGEFLKHHVVAKGGPWEEAVRAHPEWSNPRMLELPIEVGMVVKRVLKLSPSHQLHDEGIKFRYAPGGILYVECGGVGAEKLAELQHAADKKVGSGKVLFL